MKSTYFGTVQIQLPRLRNRTARRIQLRGLCRPTPSFQTANIFGSKLNVVVGPSWQEQSCEVQIQPRLSQLVTWFRLPSGESLLDSHANQTPRSHKLRPMDLLLMGVRSIRQYCLNVLSVVQSAYSWRSIQLSPYCMPNGTIDIDPKQQLSLRQPVALAGGIYPFHDSAWASSFVQ